ncbi:MAG TPA: SGNH/GDSL hydrolase family protein, partial [Clostridium sp.]
MARNDIINIDGSTNWDGIAGTLDNHTSSLATNTANITNSVTIDKKNLRPQYISYGYEMSPAKLYPYFMKALSGDLSKLTNVGVGDSWTVGQGATDIGLTQTIALPPPSGVTDGAHVIMNTSGKFIDRFFRGIALTFGLGMQRRIAVVAETTYYHVYTGTWAFATSSLLTDDINYVSSSTIGDSAILRSDAKNCRLLGVHLLKHSAAGKFNVYIRSKSAVVGLVPRDSTTWKKPSDIGMVRSDGLTGTAMDVIDEYNATTDYSQILYFTMPYLSEWELKLEVATKNASSTGNVSAFGASVIEFNNFINAGRGNHTILDYMGYMVTVGASAGATGDHDHTDHLGEVLALNPSFILLEPMIINDWYHGVSASDNLTSFHEMIKRIKLKGNCDILCMTPAVLTTTNTPTDYAANPNYATAPLLANNLNALGNYEDYLNNVLSICALEQIPVINTYAYFLEEFNKPTHQNWTLGDTAGRIHVNQIGHNLLYNALVE